MIKCHLFIKVSHKSHFRRVSYFQAYLTFQPSQGFSTKKSFQYRRFYIEYETLSRKIFLQQNQIISKLLNCKALQKCENIFIYVHIILKILVWCNTLGIILCRNWTQGRTWKNLSSGEKERFLEEVLGSEHKYGKIQVWFPSILYPIISLLGIPGNILTCLSIYKIPYMRTPSNFFIFNLALSDLLSLSFGTY